MGSVGANRNSGTSGVTFGIEPSASEYGNAQAEASRNASKNGYEVSLNNVGWRGAYVTTPSGKKFSVINTGGSWRKEYAIYNGNRGYSSKTATDKTFESLDSAIDWLKKKYK